MSNFKFKGIPLSDVINTTGGTPATGYGFTYNTTTFANSKPLTTGYRRNNVDIANTATANVETYKASTSVTIPTGAKSFRFIGRGGGGGGSGGGGGAESKWATPAWQHGGNGAAGGNGAFVYITDNNVGAATTLNVFLGAGGNFGAGGA